MIAWLLYLIPGVRATRKNVMEEHYLVKVSAPGDGKPPVCHINEQIVFDGATGFVAAPVYGFGMLEPMTYSLWVAGDATLKCEREGQEVEVRLSERLHEEAMWPNREEEEEDLDAPVSVKVLSADDPEVSAKENHVTPNRDFSLTISYDADYVKSVKCEIPGDKEVFSTVFTTEKGFPNSGNFPNVKSMESVENVEGGLAKKKVHVVTDYSVVILCRVGIENDSYTESRHIGRLLARKIWEQLNEQPTELKNSEGSVVFEMMVYKI